MPLEKHHRETPINQVRIRVGEPWRELILAQIEHYKRIAPYYEEVVDFLREALTYETDMLSNMDVHLLKGVCAYLDIPFRSRILSECNLELPPAKAPDDWALNISLALGAAEYINPPGEPASSTEKSTSATMYILNFWPLIRDGMIRNGQSLSRSFRFWT